MILITILRMGTWDSMLRLGSGMHVLMLQDPGLGLMTLHMLLSMLNRRLYMCRMRQNSRLVLSGSPCHLPSPLVYGLTLQ